MYRSDGIATLNNNNNISNRTNTLTRVGPSSSPSPNSYNNHNNYQPVTERPHPTQLYPLSAIPFLDSVPPTNTRLDIHHSYSSSSSYSQSPPSSTTPPPPQTIDTDTHNERPQTRYNTYSYSIVDSQGKEDPSGPTLSFVPISNSNRYADSNVVESKQDTMTVETDTPRTQDYSYEVYELLPSVTQKPQSFQLAEETHTKSANRLTLTHSDSNNATEDSPEVIPLFYRPREDGEEVIEPTTYSPVDFRMPTQRYPTPFTPSPTTAAP